MAARNFVPELKPAVRRVREPVLPTIPAPPTPELLAGSGTIPRIVSPPLPVIDEDIVDEDILEEDVIEVDASELEEVEMDPSGVFVAPLGEADLAARGASLRAVPVVCRTASEIRALPLDPASAFLLGAMDGALDIESLIDFVPLSREDVVRSVCLLLDHKVIRLT